jgi:hypothetical protein
VTKEIYTDKASYEYGEIIQITYSIDNQTNEYHSYKGTGTYSVHFVDFSGVSLIPTATTTDDFRDTLWPGESIEYIWELDPKVLGLPKESGEQSVSISMLGLIDSVSFNAPKYKGGPIQVYFNEEIVDTAEADRILNAYNAEIVRSRFPSYSLIIHGFQIDSLSDAWLADELILEAHFEQRNDIYEISYQRTDNEIEAPLLSFQLLQNYPNPFNPSTTIPFTLQKSGIVDLDIYDLKGALIKSVYRGWLQAGYHTFDFNAERIASGIYFYQLDFEGRSVIKSMTFVK